jgi:hypothetical protein
MSSSSSSAMTEVSGPVETFETTVKRSSSVCLNTLAETEISSDVLPNETPRLLKLEEICESEKEVNDLDLLLLVLHFSDLQVFLFLLI